MCTRRIMKRIFLFLLSKDKETKIMRVNANINVKKKEEVVLEA